MKQEYAKLKDVKFGKLDAYTEYVEYGKDMYKSLFFMCPYFHVERFLNGESYYIHGEKGTGKTALLKYIEIMARENKSLVEYIRFKKDVDEEEKNEIKHASIPTNFFEEIIDSEVPSDSSINCVLAWQVYIFKCIVNRCNAESMGVFERDDNWNKLSKLIKSAYPNEMNRYKKILPTIKKGNLSLDLKSIKLGIDMEWINKEVGIINFPIFAKTVISLYKKLTHAYGLCYVLIDEIELVYLEERKYKRDVALIRDLIQAVNYMNDISKEKNYQVRVIACIRNEVYRSVQSIGAELNKMIQDYGVEVSWLQHGKSISQNPLIMMLDNRLLQSQTQEIREKGQSVWNAYFGEEIQRNGKSIMKYIIDLTWYKPRDITRLFVLIQKLSEDRTKIRMDEFNIAKAKYSEESWAEFSNELSVKYSREEVDAIRQVLTGIQARFTVQLFDDRINELKKMYASVNILRKNRTAADIMADLYRLGVIGNDDGTIVRFVFKGNENFDPLSPFTIHYPLRKFFSVKYSKDKRRSRKGSSKKRQ